MDTCKVCSKVGVFLTNNNKKKKKKKKKKNKTKHWHKDDRQRTNDGVLSIQT